MTRFSDPIVRACSPRPWAWVALALVAACGGSGAGVEGGAPGAEPPEPFADFDWLPAAGGRPGIDGSDGAGAVAWVPDPMGGGGYLLAGGQFAHAGGIEARNLAHFDGLEWQRFAGSAGTDQRVLAIASFDDGGPQIVIGGEFREVFGPTSEGAPSLTAGAVARFDGKVWLPMGQGMESPPGAPLASVNAFAVYDDGKGERLIAAGRFSSADGAPAGSIAAWDGVSWSSLGEGLFRTSGPAQVRALAVHDEGEGPRLFAAGLMDFASAQGVSVPAANIARWDGLEWSAVGAGLPATPKSLASHSPSGGAPLLVAGGQLFQAGASEVLLMAWNGKGWTPYAGGLQSQFSTPSILSMGSFDLGDGPMLYVGSNSPLIVPGVEGTQRIARHDGQEWLPVGSAAGLVGTQVSSLAQNSDPGLDVPELLAFGIFSSADGLGAANAAAFRIKEGWSNLGQGFDQQVSALEVFDDGSGAALFAGGSFRGIGGLEARGLARFAEGEWSNVAGELNGIVHSLATYRFAGVSQLVVGGGLFTEIGGVATTGIAAYDGQEWSALGAGIGGSVFALAVAGEDTDALLFAGGSFSSAGGSPAASVASWDGAAWSPLGTGLGPTPSVSGPGVARAFAIFDDGRGPALYVGGRFGSAGGVPALRLARWDGESWEAVGDGVGVPSSSGDAVVALHVHDDGAGQGLYVGGSFAVVGGQEATQGLAVWDGKTWSGQVGGYSGEVRSFLSLPDPALGAAAGPGVLVLGGNLFFGPQGTEPVAGMLRWDGKRMQALPQSPSTGFLSAMAAFDWEQRGVLDLLVGGSFQASAREDSYLARWGRSSNAVSAQGVDQTQSVQWIAVEACENAGFAEDRPCPLANILGPGMVLDDLDGRRVFERRHLKPAEPIVWLAGAIELHGGSWTSDAPLVLGVAGPAELVLSGGARIEAPRVLIGPGAILRGEGLLVGDLELEGRLEPSSGGIQLRGRLLNASEAPVELWPDPEGGASLRLGGGTAR